jgi:hypothetical protein
MLVSTLTTFPQTDESDRAELLHTNLLARRVLNVTLDDFASGKEPER